MVQEDSSSVLLTGFALDSQSGVAGVLRAIRKSEADSRTKNDLRNLVLQYTSSGGDQGLRTALEANLLAAGIAADNTSSVQQPVNKKMPVSTFGFAGSRPQPVIAFSAVPVATPEETSQPVSKPAATNPAPVESATTRLPVSEVSSVPPTPPIAPATSHTEITAAEAPSNPAPAVVIPTAEKVTKPAVVINEVPPEKTTPAPATEPTPRATAAIPDFDNYLNRIKVIKNEVNRQYGSPVGIVNVAADLGHEYMAALLNAMKELSIESAGSLQAMERLEAAFTKVKALSGSEAVTEDLPQTVAVKQDPVSEVTEMPLREVPISTPSQAPVINQAPQKAVIPPRPVATAPTASESQSATINSSRSQNSDTNRVSISAGRPQSNVDYGRSLNLPTEEDEDSADFKSKVTQQVRGTGVPNVPARQSLQDRLRDLETGQKVENDLSPATPAPKNTWEAPAVAKAKVAQPATPNIISTPTSLNNSSQVKSVTEDSTPLKTPQDLPSAAEIAAANSGGDPLFSIEVNQGLDQLLSEWVLFKKSGLFGSGPKGVDHPLFKKLANIQVPLLLAGRFEGATQEIRQSITDYMNGWRYEQGIVYEKGETFEQYLRRVIRHIIDLQK